MRCPHFEAAAALGAIGVVIGPDLNRPAPGRPSQAGDRRANKNWRPRAMPAHARFALHPDPENAAVKPFVFDTADQLVRHLHAKRGDRAIQVTNALLRFEGDQPSLAGVSLWTLGDDGAKHQFLGWAYLDGADRHKLERLLEAAQPQTVAQAGRAAA